MNPYLAMLLIWLTLGVLCAFLRIGRAWCLVSYVGVLLLIPAAAVKVLFFL